MQHRIIKPALGGIVAGVLFSLSPLFAQQTPNTAVSAAPLDTQVVFDFNALLGVLQNRQQFLVEPVQNGEPILVETPGIGDGHTLGNPPTLNGVPISGESHFCSSEDEEDQYLRLGGSTGPGGGQHGLNARGHFIFSKTRDLWREIRRDGKAFYLGNPLVAQTCSRFGKKSVLNFDHWRNFHDSLSNGDTPERRTVVRNHFADRNFLEDNFDFRYGLYPFRFLPADDFDPAAFGRVTGQDTGIDRNLEINEIYRPNFYEPTTLSCPYGREHQRWGFLCPELATAGVYASLNLEASRSILLPYGPQGAVDAERWHFWPDLLRQAVDMIGARIDQNYWGRLRPRMAFGSGAASWEGNEREMAGIVVTIWEILKNQVDRISATSAPNGWGRMVEGVLGTSHIYGECGNVPGDLLVGLDRSGSNPKLVFRKDLCVDVLSKKTLSHSHFNVASHPDQMIDNASINASYGFFSGGGVYEHLFEPNRGYQWIVDANASVMRANPIDGKVTARGYGGVIVSLMAHQLCHLHYRENNVPFQWGSLQGVSEESLCVMAQALVHDALSILGHQRTDSGMREEDYNPDGDPNQVTSVDGMVGKRFYYQDEPKAMSGIVIAPLYEDMVMIAQNLKNQDPEMARMGAFLLAVCSFFPEPRNASLNGQIRTNPYYVAPQATPPPVAEEPRPTVESGPPASSGSPTSPGQQVEQGTGALGDAIGNREQRPQQVDLLRNKKEEKKKGGTQQQQQPPKPQKAPAAKEGKGK